MKKYHSDWLALEEVELFLHSVSPRDIRDEDSEYDNLRFRYWIKKDSQTATILALKGCRFNTPDPHKL